MTRLLAVLLAALCAAPAAAEPTGRYIVTMKGSLPALGRGVVARDMRCRAVLVTGSVLAAGKKGWGTRIEAIEPEVLYTRFQTPNDPLYPSQWHFGTGYGIRLAAARTRARGLGAVVAVVDTGIRKGSDLAGTTILPGRDLVNNDADATDDNGHGTHVAGTIAQTTDNGLGGAGIAPAAALLPVKVLSASGSGSNLAVASGIRYAADQGAHVINLSLGGGASETVRSAVNYALAKGCVVVAAAGNSGGSSLAYPAGYAGVIAVGAITNTGLRASFSQYGPNLALVAPGVNVIQQTWSPTRGWTFASWNGTSMAAPHVAGVAALIKGIAPTTLPADVRALLVRTAKPLGPAAQYGAGALDAEAALAALGAPTPVPTPTPPVPPTPNPSGEVAEVLSLLNAARAENGLAPLASNAQLTTAAQGHAADMAARGYFSHKSPEGEGPGGRIARAGYVAITWGENIARGYRDPATVHAAWMASSGHRANILRAAFREVGIGIARAPDGRPYWVQCFGAR